MPTRGLQGDSRRDGALALRRQDALGARKILLGGDLEIVLVAGRERNGQPGMLRHRGIVGQRTASRGAVSVENCAIAEALGGLSPPEALARHRACDHGTAGCGPFEAVAHRERGECAVVAGERV